MLNLKCWTVAGEMLLWSSSVVAAIATAVSNASLASAAPWLGEYYQAWDIHAACSRAGLALASAPSLNVFVIGVRVMFAFASECACALVNRDL